ncbi:MAG TPA: response regulator [Burkholderiales bacterium]|nr:response regulator [Burkholderiales bacterium]
MLKPILLVEDDKRDLELTLIALERSQLANEVVIVRDGELALDYLHREGDYAHRVEGNPAVILLDLKLPKVNGLEVLRVVRGTESLRSIPVVMLTSSQEESDVLSSYELGVNAYVVKPVEFKQFIATIADLGMFWAVLNEPPPGSVRPLRRAQP